MQKSSSFPKSSALPGAGEEFVEDSRLDEVANDTLMGLEAETFAHWIGFFLPQFARWSNQGVA